MIAQKLIDAMYRDYQLPLSFAELGRRYGKNPSTIRELFARRGLALRVSTNHGKERKPNGSFAAAPLLTDEQLELLIANAKKISVPGPLKLEWRKWTMARRKWFILRLREKLKPANIRPGTPFSDGLEPFDYWTPASNAIMQRMNAGRNSRVALMKIDLCSQGVIWRGELWFWSYKVGYQQCGPWTVEHGRPCLHHVIWEEANGREVPGSHVIRFADGNHNNHAAKNLVLAHRNDVARENQAGALTRKSRERTAALLSRSQRPRHATPASHDLLSSLASR